MIIEFIKFGYYNPTKITIKFINSQSIIKLYFKQLNINEISSCLKALVNHKKYIKFITSEKNFNIIQLSNSSDNESVWQLFYDNGILIQKK